MNHDEEIPYALRTLEVVPYDPRWPGRFAQEAARLDAVLGDVAVRIEHNGSTSVEELAAKPTIDILISVRSLDPIAAYKEPVESLGYVYRPRAELFVGPNQRLFRFPDHRAFHIHVCAAGGSFERDHLLFRDYLRTHPDVAREYGELKMRLASEHLDDRGSYMDAKAPFIAGVLEAARAWALATTWRP